MPKARKIEVDDLLNIQPKKNVIKEKERMSLVWTPARVEKAKAKVTFINTGWNQPSDKKLTGARFISKAKTYWGDNDETEKHSTDTIFIASVPAVSLVEYFPNNYRGKSKKNIDIYINGPKSKVIKNLQAFDILPKKLYPSKDNAESKLSVEDEIDRWLSQFAISKDNFQDSMKEDYDALVKSEPATVKGELNVLSQERLEQIMSLHGELRKGNVEVLDVNNRVIGKYPTQLSKSVYNIFTDKVIKNKDKLTDAKDASEDSKWMVLISHLASESPKVSVRSMPKNVDMDEDRYGTVLARPLNVKITLTYGSKTIVLKPGKVWTEIPKSVPILFAEMEAVTEGKLDMTYDYTRNSDFVKASVQDLLVIAQKEKKQKALDKLADETANAKVGSERNALGKIKKNKKDDK